MSGRHYRSVISLSYKQHRISYVVEEDILLVSYNSLNVEFVISLPRVRLRVLQGELKDLLLSKSFPHPVHRNTSELPCNCEFILERCSCLAKTRG